MYVFWNFKAIETRAYFQVPLLYFMHPDPTSYNTMVLVPEETFLHTAIHPQRNL